MPDANDGIDNPYQHTKLAQQFELSGDFRHAEARYKKAIVAADGLPLADYKIHLQTNVAQDHVIKQAAECFDKTDNVASLEDVENAYHELISLPFLTRLQLAGFYARHQAIPEAKDACEEAFRVGLDPIVKDNRSVLEMHDRATALKQHLADILGPEHVEQIFIKSFDKLDVNRDGFVDDHELKRAQLDLSLDASTQQVIRYLLHNYFEVEKASNDEFGMEISGITKADVHNYERKTGAKWKRMEEDKPQ
jgi:hypothetical protein